MESERSPKTSVNFYQTTRRRIQGIGNTVTALKTPDLAVVGYPVSGETYKYILRSLRGVKGLILCYNK
jgi:hypothetical protein